MNPDLLWSPHSVACSRRHVFACWSCDRFSCRCSDKRGRMSPGLALERRYPESRSSMATSHQSLCGASRMLPASRTSKFRELESLGFQSDRSIFGRCRDCRVVSPPAENIVSPNDNRPVENCGGRQARRYVLHTDSGGPTYRARGRMRVPAADCSRMWAIQPTERAKANIVKAASAGRS